MRKNTLLSGMLIAGIALSVSVPQTANALDLFGWIESPEDKELRLKQRALTSHKMLTNKANSISRRVTIDGVDCIVLSYGGRSDSIKALSCNWEKYNTEQLIKQSEENINNVVVQAKEKVIKWLEKPSK